MDKKVPEEVAIKKIELKIGKRVLSFTPDELKKVQSLLNDLFGKILEAERYQYLPIRYYHLDDYSIPMWTAESPKIENTTYCASFSNNTLNLELK